MVLSGLFVIIIPFYPNGSWLDPRNETAGAVKDKKRTRPMVYQRLT
jgi:hypothetical protein